MNIFKIAVNNLSIRKRRISNSTLTQKATLNAFAASLDYGARLVVGLLITPILVAGLGNYYFGVWQFLLRLVGYITPASGRPTQALKMTLANQQNLTDYDQKRGYVGSAFLVWLLFLPVMSVLGGILTWFVPYWIDAPASSFWIIRLSCGVLVINLIAITLSTIPQAVLEGENKGYKRMGLSTLLVFIGGGITWLFLYFETGLIGVAFAALLTTLITGIFYFWVVRQYSPWFGISRPTREMAREFLGLSWWFLGWNLVINLMTASDVIILGILMSVESVTSYTLTKYVPEVLISLVAIIVFGIIPGLGGIIGSGDLEKASRVRGEIMALTWLVLTVFGTSILLWNQLFINLWVGEEYYVGTVSNLLIVFMVFQFTLIRNDANIIDLTLHLNKKVLMGLISAALSITLACIFIELLNLGIIGLCLGIMIGRMILSIGYPVLIGRYLAISWNSQLRGTVRPILVTMVLFILNSIFSSYLAKYISIEEVGWIWLIISSGTTFICLLIISFYSGLNRTQRNNIFQRVNSILSA